MPAEVLLVGNPGWPDWTGWLGASVVKAAQPSPIYHTGVVIDGTLYESRLSTGVQAVSAECVTDQWIAVPCPWRAPQDALDVFEAARGREYDLFRGLADWALRRVAKTITGRDIRPGIDDPKRWFCSEMSATMLGLSEPVQYSPSKLVMTGYQMTLEHYRDPSRNS